MKKLSVFLPLCLLLCLSLRLSARSEEWLSIAELQAQLPQRWTETFSAQYPAVVVDVQPTVPDVQTMPVLKVRPAFWVPTADTEVPWHAEGVHFDQGGDAFILEAGDVYGEDGAATMGSGVSSESKLYGAPLDDDAPYAPGNDLTISDMVAQLEAIMRDAQPQHFGIDTEHLLYLRVTSFTSRRTGEAALPGTMSMDVLTTLRDVPIFDHVLAGVPGHRDDEVFYDPGLSFTMRSAGSYSLLGTTVHETVEVAEDIPLCSFETVRQTIAQAIDAGNVRVIYAVDLGYALYNVPGAARSTAGATKAERRAWIQSAVFYAVPTWRCVCLYADQPDKALPEEALRNPYSSIYFRTLFINAQTGALISPEDGRKGCGDYPGVTGWNAVR